MTICSLVTIASQWGLCSDAATLAIVLSIIRDISSFFKLIDINFQIFALIASATVRILDCFSSVNVDKELYLVLSDILST